MMVFKTRVRTWRWADSFGGGLGRLEKITSRGLCECDGKDRCGVSDRLM